MASTHLQQPAIPSQHCIFCLMVKIKHLVPSQSRFITLRVIKRQEQKSNFVQTQKLGSDPIPKIMTELYSYLWVVLPKGLCKKAKKNNWWEIRNTWGTGSDSSATAPCGASKARGHIIFISHINTLPLLSLHDLLSALPRQCDLCHCGSGEAGADLRTQQTLKRSVETWKNVTLPKYFFAFKIKIIVYKHRMNVLGLF